MGEDEFAKDFGKGRTYNQCRYTSGFGLNDLRIVGAVRRVVGDFTMLCVTKAKFWCEFLPPDEAASGGRFFSDFHIDTQVGVRKTLHCL